MRILVISFVFPPYNIIGAVRVGKMTKYLRRFGHDVRVLTADDPLPDRTLKLEVPADQVRYAPWVNIDTPYERILAAGQSLRNWLSDRRGPREAGASAARGPASAAGAAFNERRTLMWHVRAAYRDLLHVPDAAIGWLPSALRVGKEVTRGWQPDVIFASGAPWTAFLVARALAKRTGAPWVAELRDLWYGNPYMQLSPWRHRTVDAWLERRVLPSAAGLITVSEPLAAELRHRYPHIPVEVVLNGYDAEDFAADDGSPPPMDEDAARASDLRIVYTGNLFPGRDIAPLITALQLLGEDARSVRVEIIGNRNDGLQAHYQGLATRHGVADCFAWLPPIAHVEAVRAQKRADALLLVMNHEPSEVGIYTGKLFEYVGARRRILLIGLPTGVAAQLVRDRGMGTITTSAAEIAAVLREWLQEKRATGSLVQPQDAATEDLTREAQARVTERLLAQVARDEIALPSSMTATPVNAQVG